MSFLMFFGHGNILIAELQEPDNANNCPIPWPDRKESAVGETSEQSLGEVWLLEITVAQKHLSGLPHD